MTDKNDVLHHADDFVAMLQDTPEYAEYARQKEILNREPDTAQRVDAFRRDYFMLQHAPENEDVYEKIEDLERNNAELLNRPEVHDFMNAEASFCRLMQEVIDKVMEKIDF